ncbi:MAG: MgtC/SapB family protein [Candidatus Paceibacterota bacterium]|jgi:putative Mg2+ transporter-C (MgtC) family protein
MELLTTTDLIIRMSIAIGLGTIIGLERTLAGKGAGMRTYAIVSLGASLFILISQIVMLSSINPISINPLFLAASVITGIGFLGAGLILFQSNKITGVTTAAGLWVSAGVGMASGFGLVNLAVIATIATIIVFTIMWFIEKMLLKFSYKSNTEVEGK